MADFREAVAERYWQESRLLAEALASRSLSPREWAEALARAVMEGHARAWAWAREADGLGPDPEADLLVGRARLDAEAPYLRRFLDQVEAGWGGDEPAAAIARRSASYAGAMRGTATEGFFELAGDEERYRWVLGAVEEHCEDCPRLSAAGPWAKAEMFVWPGSNDTPCLFNCKCHLVRLSDGAESPAALW